MEVLKTTTCKCGENVDDKYIKAPLQNIRVLTRENGFYGGKIDKFCENKCKCGREYYLLIQPISKGFKVLDLILKKDISNRLDNALSNAKVNSKKQ